MGSLSPGSDDISDHLDPACPPGKDAPLAETIARGSRLLEEMGLAAAPVSWLNPAPGAWSVHFRAEECPLLASNGKGSSRAAALAGAIGEFFERLANNFFFADYFLDEAVDAGGKTRTTFLFSPDEAWFPADPEAPPPSHNQAGQELLNKGLHHFYDPAGQLTTADLLDHNADPGRGIAALPFTDLDSGRPVYFPVAILNNLYVSNGMAAGNSADEASAQALAEIIERQVKFRVIREGISLPEIPAARLHQLPGVEAILGRLAEENISVRLLDASLGGRYPVVCALLSDFNRGGVHAAFGASCRFAVAVERTLTELLQGRSLAMLGEFRPPTAELEEVADPGNLESHFVDADGLLAWQMFRDQADYRPVAWDFKGSSGEEFRHLLRLVSDGGQRVYRAEYRHCGMYACRLLVPGFSEIYPVDDLLYNNRGAAAVLRPHLLCLQQLDSIQRHHFSEILEGLAVNDRQLVADAIGIHFPAGSVWATMTFGELKALAALAIGDRQKALNWFDWCLGQQILTAPRERLFRLLQTLLQFSVQGDEVANYRNNLAAFYHHQEVAEGEALLAGRLVFPGLSGAPSWSALSAEHRMLLEIYQRINRRKSR